MKFDIWALFETLTGITATLHEFMRTFMIVYCLILVTTRNVSNKSCRENKKTHCVFNHFFFSENRADYEKTWKNVVDPKGPKMAIRRTSNACWISKATDAHSEI